MVFGSVAALALSLFVAGCGGESQAEPLKKPQFVQQANEICGEATAEREAALKEATEAGEEPEVSNLVTDVLAPPIQDMVEELDNLPAPSGDEKEVQAIISAFEQGIEKLEADPSDMTADVAAFRKANEMADAYGLACGI